MRIPENALEHLAAGVADAAERGLLDGRESIVEAWLRGLSDAGVDPEGAEASAAFDAFLASGFDGRGWARPHGGDFFASHCDDPAFPYLLLVPDDEPKRACAEATWFATAFLMPGEAFEDAWLCGDGSLAALARRFQVPLAAAAGRAIDLGLLPEGHFEIERRAGRLDSARREAFLREVRASFSERIERCARRAAELSAKPSPEDELSGARPDGTAGEALAAMEAEAGAARAIARRVSPSRLDAAELRVSLADGFHVVRLSSPEGGTFFDDPWREGDDGGKAGKESIQVFGRDSRGAALGWEKVLDDAPDALDAAAASLMRCRPNEWLGMCVLRAFGWRDGKRTGRFSGRWTKPDGKEPGCGEKLPKPATVLKDAQSLPCPGWTFSSREDAPRGGSPEGGGGSWICAGSNGVLSVEARHSTEAAAWCAAKVEAARKSLGRN